MGQYENLVKALRHCSDHLGCTECPRYDAEKARKYFGCGALEDAAAAIEALETEIRESMQKCAECGDEQEQKVKELQARLGEAENSVERWKYMYLTKHEPKRGEWIGVSPMVDTVQCSVCGGQLFSAELKTPYCPYCGAKMEVQDDKV